MSKKSNPEKGLRTVGIEFGGKTRTLKFGHTSIGNFEAEANEILRELKVNRGGMILADNFMAIDDNGMITGYIAIAKIQSCALYYALSHEDADLKRSDIGAFIDSYIENGGTIIELMRKVITAFRYATNPSSVASLMRNWQNFDGRQEILTAAENEKITAVEKAIADAKARLTPGSTSSESPA